MWRTLQRGEQACPRTPWTTHSVQMCAGCLWQSNVGGRASLRAALSAADVEHFCREGFVVLRGLVSPADVAHLRSEMVDLLQSYRRIWTPTNAPVLPTPETPMWQATGHGIDLRSGEPVGCAFDAWMKPGAEDPTKAAAAADTLNPHRVQYINDIQKLNTAVAEYNRSPRLLSALSQLLGDDINCTQCATVTKPGGINFDYHGWQ